MSDDMFLRLETHEAMLLLSLLDDSKEADLEALRLDLQEQVDGRNTQWWVGVLDFAANRWLFGLHPTAAPTAAAAIQTRVAPPDGSLVQPGAYVTTPVSALTFVDVVVDRSEPYRFGDGKTLEHGQRRAALRGEAR